VGALQRWQHREWKRWADASCEKPTSIATPPTILAPILARTLRRSIRLARLSTSFSVVTSHLLWERTALRFLLGQFRSQLDSEVP